MHVSAIKHLKGSKILLCCIFAALLPGALGCFRPTPPPDPTATPTLQPTFTLQPTILIQKGTPVMVAQPANPTASPNFEIANPVQVSELQFFQHGYEVQVLAKLQNTLHDALLRDISYQIMLLDSEGNRLAEQNGAVKYLFARETTGIVSKIDLMPGMVAASLQMQITGGKQERGLRYKQPFALQESRAITMPNGQTATARLENADPATYAQVSLNAIAYNQQGEIICGGNKPQEFVPSKSKIGVSVPLINCPEIPSIVDFYAFLTPYSSSLPDGNWQKNIKLINWGFIVDEHNRVSGGAELQNLTDRTLTHNYFMLTVYNSAGQVCLAENVSLDALWPHEEAAFSPGILDLPLNCEAKTVDLKVLPGEFGQNPLAYNPLVVSNVALVKEETGTVAKLRVVNNLNADISSASTVVILKNASGKIVGGGLQMTGNIPANGMLETSIALAYAGSLDDITLSASASIPDGVIITK
ncbi:MAG: hypothetical protein VB108_09680 [Anaerolineaceae bacterium]|nr:hypothetical protein [Anaerolineaceae bacterium]